VVRGFHQCVTCGLARLRHADGKRRTLAAARPAPGGRRRRSSCRSVIRRVGPLAPKNRARPPSPESKRQLRALDRPRVGSRFKRGKGITECFRIDRNGQVIDTIQLFSLEDADVEPIAPQPRGAQSEPRFGFNGITTPPLQWLLCSGTRDSGRSRTILLSILGAIRVSRHAGADPYVREYQTPQRVDPGYIWGHRRY